ncbi:LysR family transcriptional regulator [Pseudonocardia sp. RS11V-5]|uniref:LysR family transcriptional regulator n=1 Tax=Pseudonocardia terrae TaxID=2905831 RepID=UPI001E3C49AB|nr:LysR family transcriptional regulator [Pseudonocardia terrae]MCE3551555.1 LysR family transcriptional regulator [Pseudonocardia terrae]
MSADLRHLRAFLAIAEAGTITRAAARLHIGQPALSRTLHQLEAHLGVRLVERSTHHLALTPAGLAFREHAERAVGAVDALLDPARAGDWLRQPLRLGHAWSALGGRTPELLRRRRAEHPSLPLELVQIDTRTAGLADGRVDAAVLRGRVRIPGTRAARLPDEARMAAVPEGGDLAARASLTLADLAGRTVAINDVTGTTTPSLWPVDARPDLVRVATTEDWLVTIAAGGAAGVTPAATAQLHRFPGVAYVPLTDAPPVPVRLVWTDPPTHPAVPQLATLVQEVMGTTGDGAGDP